MFLAFCSQHFSTDCRHHSADCLLARIGLSPTSTNTGLVWLDGRMRSATQLLLLSRPSNGTSCSPPAAPDSLPGPRRPVTPHLPRPLRRPPHPARSPAPLRLA